MSESPSILSETFRELRAGEFNDAMDIVRHEGLKKAFEQGLYVAGQHELGRLALRHLAGNHEPDIRLQTSFAGLESDGLVGLAAGWDKAGKSILGMQALGADFQIPGGFTLYKQAGQLRPRLFTFDRMFGDHGKAVSLNRFRFANPGVNVGSNNIQAQRERGEVTNRIFGQVTLNKEYYLQQNRHYIPDAIRQTVRKLLPAVDGISLGLSSLNTDGMREAQNEYRFMYECYMAAQDEIHNFDGPVKPLIGKGDGDGGEDRLDVYCRLVQETGCHLELINSTGIREIKAKYGAEDEPGGLAGADEDYQNLAVEVVKYVYEEVGDKASIIGVGGDDQGLKQAIALLEAGASKLSMHTYIRTGGFQSFTNVKNGISRWLDQQADIDNIQQIIGRGTKRGPRA